MTDEQFDALIAALQWQSQLDADGCMVAVSRQACNEAADMLSYYRAALATARADGMRDAADWVESDEASFMSRHSLGQALRAAIDTPAK